MVKLSPSYKRNPSTDLSPAKKMKIFMIVLEALMRIIHELESIGEVKLLNKVQGVRSEILARKLNLEKAQRMRKK